MAQRRKFSAEYKREVVAMLDASGGLVVISSMSPWQDPSSLRVILPLYARHVLQMREGGRSTLQVSVTRNDANCSMVSGVGRIDRGSSGRDESRKPGNFARSHVMYKGLAREESEVAESIVRDFKWCVASRMETLRLCLDLGVRLASSGIP
jgi:hypothetical protein